MGQEGGGSVRYIVHLIALLLRIQDIGDVTLCHWVSGLLCLKECSTFEIPGTTCLWHSVTSRRPLSPVEDTF